MTPHAPRPGPTSPASPGEAVWRNGFYAASAMMAALALVDFEAGRWAHGLGDAGVSSLMLSLMTQFPFVQAMVRAGAREAPAQSRDALLREAERLRAQNPWAERLSHAGWILLLASLGLRVLGVQ